MKESSVRKQAPYVFHGQTTSLCGTCHELVPAKILIEGSDVYYRKTTGTWIGGGQIDGRPWSHWQLITWSSSDSSSHRVIARRIGQQLFADQ